MTEFEALCGFRDPVLTVEMLANLSVPQLDHYLSLLSGQPDRDGVRAFFSSILTIPSAMLQPLLSAVLSACVRLVRQGSVFSAEYRTALELGERYPGDPGVLASLLLNRVTLHPGEALYLAAGNLHAYLAGVGVELMANSDNVLRGGLTPKHVDVPELMRVLDFNAGDVEVLSGDEVRPGEIVYPDPDAGVPPVPHLVVRTAAGSGPRRTAGGAGGRRVGHRDRRRRTRNLGGAWSLGLDCGRRRRGHHLGLRDGLPGD